MIPPVFIGPIQQGQPRPVRCEPCRGAYAHFRINGRCRTLRRGDIAHLIHSTWRNGEALCEIPKDAP